MHKQPNDNPKYLAEEVLLQVGEAVVLVRHGHGLALLVAHAAALLAAAQLQTHRSRGKYQRDEKL